MKRTEQLKIKISLEEQAKLKARSGDLGITVSDYVRELIDLDLSKPEKIKSIINDTKQIQKSLESIAEIISKSSFGEMSSKSQN